MEKNKKIDVQFFAYRISRSLENGNFLNCGYEGCYIELDSQKIIDIVDVENPNSMYNIINPEDIKKYKTKKS